MTGARRLQEENEVISDSEVLRETFRIYGPLFAIVWLLLCYLKKRRPNAFNVRSWMPTLQCDLAKQQYGFLSWSWRVYRVSDDDVLKQCGMDALCLLRALCYAEKLALVGIFISIFLLPIYKTAPDAPDTEYITDTVVEMTIANVPERSNRLFAAVVAAYIQFVAGWYLLWKDFDWFTRNRLKFLSQQKPRNYSIYVSGIPQTYRSNEALSNYFQRVFSSDTAVYEASVALKIPNLERQVASRQKIHQRLEHCLALQVIKGVTPTHHSKPFGETVNSIGVYKAQLQELNEEISSEITRIEDANAKDNVVESYQQDSFLSFQGKDDVELGGSTESLEGQSSLKRPLSSSAKGEDNGSSENAVTMTHLNDNAAKTDDHDDLSEHGSCVKTWTGVLSRATAVLGGATNEASEANPAPLQKTDEIAVNQSNASFHLSIPKQGDEEPKGFPPTRHSSKDPDLSRSTANEEKLLTPLYTKDLKHFMTKAVPFAGRDEDGAPRHAGFVSFTSLTDANAAIQVIHSITPYQMVVHEAPNHEGILWSNVGLSQKTIQLGTLMAYVLSAAICVFYTVPVSFALSLTSVESLKEKFPNLESLLERFPWLEPLLDQLSPLLLSLFDSVLPIILKLVASFEGHVGESHLEASLFSKLSAFRVRGRCEVVCINLLQRVQPV